MGDASVFISAAMMLLSALLLGGATSYGYLSDSVLQLVAIPVFLIAIWRMLIAPPHPHVRLAIFFSIALVLVPLLQLIPLPSNIWTGFPGREAVTTAMKLSFGELPWMPLSLSPRATWLSLLSLLPFFAVFLSVQQLGFADRRRLSLIIIAIAFLSAFVGLLQVAQGPSSSLRFYEYVHRSDAIGFFANRNHFAALLYTAIVLVVAWTLAKSSDHRAQAVAEKHNKAWLFYMIGGFIIVLALLAAQLTARSRAGLGLTIVAFIGIYFMSQIGRQTNASNKSAKMIWGAVALALVFATQFALFRIMERMELSLGSDVRLSYAQLTTLAAKANMPFGSGLGSFVPVFKQFETTGSVGHVYANQAHNEFLQVWLEAGVAGLLLMALFAAWYFYRTYRIWRFPHAAGREIDHLLARAATIIIALVCLHSIVDYPLRTVAMMAVMAFALALLIDPPAHMLEHEEVGELEKKSTSRKSRRRRPPTAQPIPARPIPNHPLPGPTAPPQNLSPDKTPWEGVEWPEEWRKKDK